MEPHGRTPLPRRTHEPSSRRRRSAPIRKPPPESTGEERRFLSAQLKSGSRVGLYLVDGTFNEGVVRAFDELQIEIGSDDRPPVVFPKSRIRYIEEL